MKILLIVITIIAVTTIILHLIKAKVEIFFGETKRVVVKFLFLEFDTSKLKKKEKKKKNKKPEQKKKNKLLFFSDYCRIAGRAVKIFNRKLVIKMLKCNVLVATDDAAKTALTFGKVSAGVNIFCGAICNNFKVVERDVRVNADFTKQKSEYDVYINMELSLLGGLMMLFSVAVCAVRAIIKNKNKAV